MAAGGAESLRGEIEPYVAPAAETVRTAVMRRPTAA